MSDSSSILEVFMVGPHQVQCSTDFYRIECIGDVSPEHMPGFFDLADHYVQKCGYVLGLVDVTRLGTMHPAARRLTVERRKRVSTPIATAIVGAGLVTRALTTLVFKAVVLVTSRQSDVVFFKSEPEARAWLDEKREILRNPSTTRAP